MTNQKISVDPTLEPLGDLLPRIMFLAVGFLLAVWLVYIVRFWNHGFSSDPEQWGQLGDFIGGVTNPILSFLTLMVLVFTILVQIRQLAVSAKQLETSSEELALSRKELEMTREELRRSAVAQEEAQKALKAQAETSQHSARLSTISFLMERYDSELGVLRNMALMANDPRIKRFELLTERRSVLVDTLDKLYGEVIGEEA